MESTIHSLPTLSLLRDHVRQTLCVRDRLDAAQAELREARIVRGDRTCGVFFQIRGPRLLRTYAIWSGDEKRILYYESTGVRFAETKLAVEPNPDEIAA
ncbi:MAG: hypothetical protein ACJ8C4_17275 [Gemmataceae bacterium]